MCHVTIRFYEELNDLLPAAQRKRDIEVPLHGRRAVKDVIESFGVPHTEVDLVLVNGEPAESGQLLQPGDRVSVYPVFETLPVGDVTRVRGGPLRQSRFLCDVHLGKLARRLRLLGFDTVLAGHEDDAHLVQQCEREQRVLLTCDRRLLMRNEVTRGVLIRSPDANAQVRQVLDRLHLRGECAPFTRCTSCNGPLEEIKPDTPAFENALAEAPPRVREWCGEFQRCEGCGRLYWPGTHYERLRAQVLDYLRK